jgi:ethanolamine ammonia-lyase small subunit
MDALLTLLGAAGCTFIMGVPGADDVMLGYQSTSFHDALYVRRALGKRPAPEFEAWLERMGLFDAQGGRRPVLAAPAGDSPVLAALGDLQAEMVHTSSAASLDWDRLRAFTPARIGIDPVGVSQPTSAHLAFQWDHAQARDAVHSKLKVEVLRQCFQTEESALAVVLHSQARDRQEYLVRPDLGRRLDAASADALAALPQGWDVVVVVADGLSATAVNRYAPILRGCIVAALGEMGWRIGPSCVVQQGRVAIGDDVAVRLNADMVIVLIGERPGLSAPDSLGVYLTWKPRLDTVDSERNCISNVREGGLPCVVAAARLLYLVEEARRLGLSGVGLKEDAETVAQIEVAEKADAGE